MLMHELGDSTKVANRGLSRSVVCTPPSKAPSGAWVIACSRSRKRAASISKG